MSKRLTLVALLLLANLSPGRAAAEPSLATPEGRKEFLAGAVACQQAWTDGTVRPGLLCYVIVQVPMSVPLGEASTLLDSVVTTFPFNGGEDRILAGAISIERLAALRGDPRIVHLGIDFPVGPTGGFTVGN